MAPRIKLLIIDPEDDFCKPDGALSVKDADKDMSRLAKMVKRILSHIRDIHITQDAHHSFDVAHPPFWRNVSNKHPDPFTIISADDVERGIWTPSVRSLRDKMLSYVRALEASARYPLCIWPEHCLIGSPGMNIVADLFAAVSMWEQEKAGAIVDYVTKGSNPFTEHYSAVKAEVPDPKDLSTQINTGLIETLKEADLILCAGEAGSHCLANTVRDIAEEFGDDYVKKLMLIEDATSPVPGFETQQDEFIHEMVGRQMQTTTTDKFDPRKI